MHGSITRLATCLDELEGKVDQPSTFDFAQDMGKRLVDLDKEFREQHYKLVDPIDERENEAFKTKSWITMMMSLQF